MHQLIPLFMNQSRPNPSDQKLNLMLSTLVNIFGLFIYCQHSKKLGTSYSAHVIDRMQGEDINELSKGEQFAISDNINNKTISFTSKIFHIAHYITLLNSVLLIAISTKLDHTGFHH